MARKNKCGKIPSKSISSTKNKPPAKSAVVAEPKPEPVIKSPLDPNEYVIKTLPNGLRALLISTCVDEVKITKNDINPKSGVYTKIDKFNREVVKIPPDDSDSDRNADDSGFEIDTSEDDSDSDSDTDTEPEPKNKKVKRESDQVPKSDGSNKATVCLAVGVGSMHSPNDFPGLAHLCEHVISFGSKKYPEPEFLTKHIEHWEGISNASTYIDLTTYFFEMNLKTAGIDRFETAVDIFADSISNPIFPADEVNKEVHAVDSEFNLANDDEERLWQLLWSLCDKAHPFGKFICGNCETLGKKNLHKILCEWKNRHYAANYMTVIMKASLPLSELEKITIQCFGQMYPSCLPAPMYEMIKHHGNPFDTKCFRKLYKMVPSKDEQLAMITWVLHPKFINNFKTKPFLYLSHFFEPDSSFVQYLRDKHWAYSISIEFGIDLGVKSFCSLFPLTIKLTDSGVVEILQIVKALFSYLKMVSEFGNAERIFNNIRRKCVDSFHYDTGHPTVSEAEDLLEMTCQLQSLSTKEQKYILTSRSLVTDFDPKLIAECVNYFKPLNMNVIVCSKSFEEECEEEEKWCKTKYCSYKFTENFLKKCENIKVYKEFKPPQTFNPFRLKVITCPSLNYHVDDDPIIILNTPKVLVQYFSEELCSIGRIPSGIIKASICAPLISQSELGSVLVIIWKLMMKEKLRNILHQAKIASLSVKILSSPYGELIQFILIGAAKHQTKLMKLLLQTFIDFEEIHANREVFEDYQKLLVRNTNKHTLDSANYSKSLNSFIVDQNRSSVEGLAALVMKADYLDFCRFMKNFTDRMYISVYLSGCFPESDTNYLAKHIESMTYRFRELPEDFPAQLHMRAMQLPSGERCLRVKAKSDIKTSTVVNYYQFGNLCIQERTLLQFLVKILDFPAYFQLRFREHLSYVVRTKTSYYQYLPGIVIEILPQPHRHTTGYVDERIDTFLAEFRQRFPSYDNIFPTCSTCRLSANAAGFSREEYLLILKLYDDYLLPNGKNFRKLSVQVVGHISNSKCGKPLEANGITDKLAKYRAETDYNFEISSQTQNIDYDLPDDLDHKNGYFITNIEDFKNSLYAWPSQ